MTHGFTNLKGISDWRFKWDWKCLQQRQVNHFVETPSVFSLLQWSGGLPATAPCSIIHSGLWRGVAAGGEICIRGHLGLKSLAMCRHQKAMLPPLSLPPEDQLDQVINSWGPELSLHSKSQHQRDETKRGAVWTSLEKVKEGIRINRLRKQEKQQIKSKSRGADRLFLSPVFLRGWEEKEEEGVRFLCVHNRLLISLTVFVYLGLPLYLCSRGFLISLGQTFAPQPASAPLSDSTADKPSAHFDVIVGCGSGEHLKWPDISFALNKYPVTRPKQTHHLWGNRARNVCCLCRYSRRFSFSCSSPSNAFVQCLTMSFHIFFFAFHLLMYLFFSESIIPGFHICLLIKFNN